jgi:hypothetical protein
MENLEAQEGLLMTNGQIETRLWEAADKLWANTGLMPVGKYRPYAV